MQRLPSTGRRQEPSLRLQSFNAALYPLTIHLAEEKFGIPAVTSLVAYQEKCTRALIMSTTHNFVFSKKSPFVDAQTGPPVNPRAFTACLWNIFIHVNRTRRKADVALNVFNRLLKARLNTSKTASLLSLLIVIINCKSKFKW